MSEMVCQINAEGRKACTCESCQQSRSEDVRQNSISGALMFVLGCLTSPCCTPLLIPLLLGLFVGTPFAVWVSANLGLIYGGLTLISVISFTLAYRQWTTKKE